MMETLVDPHPANNNISQQDYSCYQMPGGANLLSDLSDLAKYAATTAFIAAYQSFQNAAQDPSASVPSNVQAATEYYQQTPASELSSGESYLKSLGRIAGLDSLRFRGPDSPR